MKKEYEKPILTDSDTSVNFVPALSFGAPALGLTALAGMLATKLTDADEYALVRRSLERVEKVR